MLKFTCHEFKFDLQPGRQQHKILRRLFQRVQVGQTMTVICTEFCVAVDLHISMTFHKKYKNRGMSNHCSHDEKKSIPCCTSRIHGCFIAIIVKVQIVRCYQRGTHIPQMSACLMIKEGTGKPRTMSPLRCHFLEGSRQQRPSTLSLS